MKTILLAGAVVFGLLPSVWAFSPAGPVGNGGDSWQSPVIGYGGLEAPKNIGEEYRRNIPTNYYAFDANFLGFFGSNGVAAVDGAFTIMNNLTNVSSYSADLSEFPLGSRHVNYQAEALGLFDLKSFALGAMVEQAGLADPLQWVWTLHDRFHVGSIPCPVGMEYLVVQRNFDYISSPLNQLQYSPYVNNVLYSYQILESCPGALAQPFSVDPLAADYAPVASFAIGWGDFYTGLTRDDVAGLRHLLRANNVNWESPAPGATATIITTNLLSEIPFPANSNTPSGFGTFDLASLTSAARTNDPATLEQLFPGVIVATSSNYLTVVDTPILTTTFKYLIGAPAGSAPKLVVQTNGYTYSSQTIYVTTFANIVTNHYQLNPQATLQTVMVGPEYGAPQGSPSVTNISTTTVTLTNQTAGDYYSLAPDLCPQNLIGVLYTNVFTTTNLLTLVNTNLTVANTDTNGVTSSNTTIYAYAQFLVQTFTNYAYRAHPVDCTQATNGAALYQGIENMKFVKSSYDSLIGQFFQPITNNYTMVSVINSQAKVQNFQRVVTTPDFLFSAQDLASGPENVPSVATYSRNLNFDTANVLAGLAGPGTITPSSTITLNKSGPVYYNSFGDVMDGTPYFNGTPNGDTNDLYYLNYFVWGSYDGTTNAPVVYPNGTSIDNLENQILVQVSPASLANGTRGVAYPATTFTATGGAFSPPFTWSLAFGSGMPAGMTLSSTGTLSGTPSQSGTFDLILQLTDSLSRSVQWNYSLTIQ